MTVPNNFKITEEQVAVVLRRALAEPRCTPERVAICDVFSAHYAQGMTRDEIVEYAAARGHGVLNLKSALTGLTRAGFVGSYSNKKGQRVYEIIFLANCRY